MSLKKGGLATLLEPKLTIVIFGGNSGCCQRFFRLLGVSGRSRFGWWAYRTCPEDTVVGEASGIDNRKITEFPMTGLTPALPIEATKSGSSRQTKKNSNLPTKNVLPSDGRS